MRMLAPLMPPAAATAAAVATAAAIAATAAAATEAAIAKRRYHNRGPVRNCVRGHSRALGRVPAGDRP